MQTDLVDTARSLAGQLIWRREARAKRIMCKQESAPLHAGKWKLGQVRDVAKGKFKIHVVL